MILPTIIKGDRLLLFDHSWATNNMGATADDTHANVTLDSDSYRHGIPIRYTPQVVLEVWRNDVQIYPPETVQERLL